jgi:cytochrome o ubiquinol oxidase subunit II
MGLISKLFSKLPKRIAKRYIVAISLLTGVAAVAAIILILYGRNIAVLSPKGRIAQEQFDLIVLTTLLSLIIIVPVFGLTFFIAWKYREGNKKAKYQPEWSGNRTMESIWWLIPLALITVLAVITWKTSHSLDPYKPLASDKKPLTVQVIALPWKWVFIYPEQNIATVNVVQFPEDTPINFEITADAPMNSFWIPQLGGQVYAMAGMKTKLHLQADHVGDYSGSSANISGAGFAGMKFVAKATSQKDFAAWLDTVRQSPRTLTAAEYSELAKPSSDVPPAHYAAADKDLYDTVILKYMAPKPEPSDNPTTKAHH